VKAKAELMPERSLLSFFIQNFDDGECIAYMSVKFCIDISSADGFTIDPILVIIAEL
jgi:hypothetical protein